jgi:serine/threonine protein phosphatase 1
LKQKNPHCGFFLYQERGKGERMSKWRPTELNCIYVISDIHGMAKELELILNRILPLRKSDGGKDLLIFLGDYIDRRFYSSQVLDIIIDTKNKYPEQVVCLRGNHESMLLDAIDINNDSNKYLLWMKNGGEETLMGYLYNMNSEVTNPYLIDRNRLTSYIPMEHIDFIMSLPVYYEMDDFIFVHGGIDPFEDPSKQDHKVLMWDRSLYETCKNKLHGRMPWNKTIVTGHNGYPEGELLIKDKFMMLDRNIMDELLIVELNSMQSMVAKLGKKRLVKFDLKPYTFKPLDSSIPPGIKVI